jgi:hypothetical protein
MTLGKAGNSALQRCCHMSVTRRSSLLLYLESYLVSGNSTIVIEIHFSPQALRKYLRSRATCITGRPPDRHVPADA